MSVIRKRLTSKARGECFLEAKGLCHICGFKIETGQAWEVEHVIPLAIGGDDTPENRRPAHVKCHKTKTSKDRTTISKTERMRLKHLGAWRSRTPMNWRRPALSQKEDAK